MKSAILSFVLLSASMTLCGQEFKDEMKVGDRLPMTELRNMINYPTKTLKFSDHKPKLTILDFWATTCGGCVASWPKMLALQKEFGKDLQIILISRREDEKKIKDYIAARRKLTGVDMNLPNSCGDTTLFKWFPRRTVPRYYWIDSNGVIGSITHSNQVVSSTIKRWIESGPFEMDQIVEDMVWVNGNKPIFVDGNGGTGKGDKFIWSSTLTNAVGNVAGNSEDYTDPIRGYGICRTGGSIETLYTMAYNERFDMSIQLIYMHKSRTELSVKDTAKYRGYVNGVRSRAARYNYQLIAGRPMTRQQLQKIMQQDLDRYFGLTVTWEKRKKACLVITMFDSTKAKSKTFGKYNDVIGETRTLLDNVTMQEVVFSMEQGSFFDDPRPIIDETHFKGTLTGIDFEAHCKDIKALDRAFSRFGIHIREEIREVDILVLSDPEVIH